MRGLPPLAVLCALGASVAGCPSLDIESMRFRCGGDDQCIDGWACDPIDRECVPRSMLKDAGPRDAGTRCNPPCSARAMCDEEARECKLLDSVCLEVPAGTEACGFSASFRGQIAEDFTPAGGATCSTEGWALTADQNQAGAMWHARTFALDRFAFEATFLIEPVERPGVAMRGDGIALAWIDGADTSVGAGGKFLGAAGLDGYYVELDTKLDISARCRPEQEPPVPHVAIVRTTTSSGQALDVCSDVEIVATATIAETVQAGGAHTMRVELDTTRPGGGRATIAVFVDDRRALESELAYQKFNARFGATAGSSDAADRHVLRQLTLTCP